jgi:hypothetical protein
MLRSKNHRRRLVWLMLVTLVMATLVPSLSRAAAFLQGDMAPWSVVCAAPDDSADPAAAPADAQHLLAHCPLCLLQAGGLGLPPDVQPVVVPAALGQVVPRLFLQAPCPLHAWSSAQPRAPPRLA